MRTHSRFAVAIAALTTASSSLAAPIAPRPPIAQGSSPIPPGSRCTVEALNVGGIVRPDGSMFVPNVPSNQGQVRLRAACTDPFGAVSQGQSAPVTPIPGSAVSAGGVEFGATTPIAARLTILPAAASLTGLGAAQQLSVGSVFADQTSGDVTAAAAGTVYRSSNPAVVSVSPDGLLTAVGLGTAIVSAQNEGALGFAAVSVRSAPLVSLEVTPPSISLSVNPAYRQPAAQLAVQGVLATGEVMPLGSAASGVEYSSSDPTVAVAGVDGAIIAVAAGSATITITEPTGVSTQVPVTVTSFSPSPAAAHDTPGFARNVDLRGSLAFIADGAAGLQILDVWTGAIVGAMSFGGSSAVDVRLRDSLAVVGLSSGEIALIDVSAPAQPRFLSQFAVNGAVQSVWISGHRVYVATTARLSVVDLSNPAAPSLVGSQALGAAVNAVAADTARDVVVAVTAQPAVVVLRTDGPTPWPTATLPLPAATNQASDVVLLGSSAYVANGRDGLRVVDVTDPAQPSLRGASTLNFNALGVALQRTARGTVLAAADNLFVNAVPLFEPGLSNTFNIDFSGFGGAVLPDANGTGVALGEGFGVVTVGDAGIQVFWLEEPTDNAGAPPAVSLTQPADQVRVRSGRGVPIAALASDDVGVASVEFLVDGALHATDAAPPFSASMVAGPPCGQHTVAARAIDWGGNEALSLPVTVRVRCEDGQPCVSGVDCVSGVCTGGACESGVAGGPPDCAAILAASPGAPSGVYTIDPDGVAAGGVIDVYCNMTAAGGGWQLVSVRHSWQGELFADASCTSLNQNCSGTIPEGQIQGGVAPDLLFATVDDVYWLRMTGLSPPGAGALLDVITLQRSLTASGSCAGTHYCNIALDPGLQVHSTSPSFTARFTSLPSQFARYGGIWFGNGGGGQDDHVVSINYFAYCGGAGGLDLSSPSNMTLGNVRCATPGALYFRYH